MGRHPPSRVQQVATMAFKTTALACIGRGIINLNSCRVHPMMTPHRLRVALMRLEPSDYALSNHHAGVPYLLALTDVPKYSKDSQMIVPHAASCHTSSIVLSRPACDSHASSSSSDDFGVDDFFFSYKRSTCKKLLLISRTQRRPLVQKSLIRLAGLTRE